MPAINQNYILMKFRVLLIIGCIMSVAAFQQKSYAQSPMLGLRVGLNLDNTSGDDIENKFHAFFLGGIYAGIKFEKISIQAEGYFTQTRVSAGDNFGNAFKNYLKQGATNVKDGDFKMNELSIPVLVGFKVAPRLWLQAGPQFTSVVSIKDKDDLLKETKDVFKSGYVSGVVGAWVDLPFHLNASARYIFGISDRNSADDVPATWRTSHIQLSVGLKLL